MKFYYLLYPNFSAHNNRLTCLRYAQQKKRLFSADEDGNLVCWDMTAKRVETPEWKTSDNCQLCDSPFFWNFREMWDKKVTQSIICNYSFHMHTHSLLCKLSQMQTFCLSTDLAVSENFFPIT